MVVAAALVAHLMWSAYVLLSVGQVSSESAVAVGTPLVGIPTAGGWL